MDFNLADFIRILVISLIFTVIMTTMVVYLDRKQKSKKRYEIYQDNHGYFIRIYESFHFLKINFKSDYILREDIPSIERKIGDDSITRIKYFAVLEEVENYIKKLSNPTKLIKEIS